MPLTFIAGVYGMNFKFMPELEWRWGYPLILLIMITIGILILFYFKRKKWLGGLKGSRGQEVKFRITFT